MEYLDELDMRKVGKREWMLLSRFRFLSDKYPGIFVAPAGIIINLASIPRILWVILPPIDNYDEAAVIHDAACNNQLLTINGDKIYTIKKVADDLFLEALGTETLRKSKVGPKLAKIMYLAVKHFGSKQGV